MSISIEEIETKLQNNQEIDPYDKIIVAEILNEIINRAKGIIIKKVYEINDQDNNKIILKKELKKYTRMQPPSVELLKENIQTIKILKAKINNENNFIAEIGVN